jgi:hypothetical protein
VHGKPGYLKVISRQAEDRRQEFIKPHFNITKVLTVMREEVSPVFTASSTISEMRKEFCFLCMSLCLFSRKASRKSPFLQIIS